MRAGSNPVDKLHFAVKKNFTHLLPAVVQKKIERLYQVIITFKEKDVVGQWIQLEGEPVDQRNAMSYCHAICNPDETAMVRLSGPLYDESIERIESQTNAVIKQVSVSGFYRIGGSKSSMALALSILDDIQSSGIFGTPARSQLATEEVSVCGSTSKLKSPPDFKSNMQILPIGTDEVAGVSACKRNRLDTNLKSKEKAAKPQKLKVKKNSETLSNGESKVTVIPAVEGNKTDNNYSNDAKELTDKSTESQAVISIGQDKKRNRKRKKKLSKEFKSGDNCEKQSKAGRELPCTITVSLKDLVDEALISKHDEQLTEKDSAAQQGNIENEQKSAVFTAASEAESVPNESSSHDHDLSISTHDHDLSISSISFTEEPSKKVTRSRKTSKASKRLSMSLVSILNSSNARMDNCLEAPDTVKRAIISCLESEQDKKLDSIDDSVILIDNDEDENQCLDVSHIVISDDEEDDDDDDNNITVVNLDDTVIEVNNNDLAFDDIEQKAADNAAAAVDEFTTLKKSVVRKSGIESDENKDPSKRTEKVVSAKTNLVKEQTTETVQKADNQSSHRSDLNKIVDKKRQALDALYTKATSNKDNDSADKTTEASKAMKRNSTDESDSKIKDSKRKKSVEKKERTTEAPTRYRTPYVNRSSKEKSKRKLRSISAERKKRKKTKLKLPKHGFDETDKYSKRVEAVDECRTPEVTSTSSKGRMIVPRTPITPYLVGWDSLRTRKLRYIVIDGSNVAMAHGNRKVFSCRGILIAVDYFRRRGHDLITVFLPQWRKCRQENPNMMVDQHILDKLEREGYLVFTPSRRIERKLIASYDDRFIIELAEREDGVVVSNDNFRDLMKEKHSWRRVIEERLLMFSFVHDHFMLPEDPLGRYGPTLEMFLQH